MEDLAMGGGGKGNGSKETTSNEAVADERCNRAPPPLTRPPVSPSAYAPAGKG
jgi:hypothetical protein